MTSDAPQRTVLLADDDPFIVSLYRDKLMREGVQVESVQNGEEAVKRIQSAPPDLLVLDLNMPRMDGTSVLRFIREQSATPELPVIVLSNACAPDFIEKVNRLRPARFLVKYDHAPNNVITEILAVLGGTPAGQPRTTPVSAADAEIVPQPRSMSVPEWMRRLEEAEDLERQREILLDIYRGVQGDLQRAVKADPLSSAFQFGELMEKLFEDFYARSDLLPPAARRALALCLTAIEPWLHRVGEKGSVPALVVVCSADREQRETLRANCDRPGLYSLVTGRDDTAADVLAENWVSSVVWSARRIGAAKKLLRRIRAQENGESLHILFLLPEEDANQWGDEVIDPRTAALPSTTSSVELQALLFAWAV